VLRGSRGAANQVPSQAMMSLLLGGLVACAPQPASTPPQQPNPQLVFDLGGAELTTAAGTVHGGAMVSYHRDVTVDAALLPGPYTIELWGRSTRLGDEAARVELRVDGEIRATVEIPAGPGGVWTATFDAQEAGTRTLQLHFVNDAVDETGDRNVYLDAVRLWRMAAPADATTRAAAIHDGLKGANLLLVSIDTLRADHVSAYGYGRHTTPNIDALAEDGVLFRNAVSATMWTLPSHATMLTGLHPDQHGATDEAAPTAIPAEVLTLAERLRAAGYRTGGFAGGRWVHERFGFDSGFDDWATDDDWGQSIQDAAHRFEQVRQWIDTDSHAPFFAFAHVYQVHSPYDPPPPYDSLYSPDVGRFDRARLAMPFDHGPLPTPSELDAQIALYDGDLRYTDDRLGELIRWMDDRGVLDDTLVIVTADHGEEFLDHSQVGHGTLHGEVIRVPLVLHHPALAAWAEREVTQPAGAVDLVPTVLDLLGVDGPDPLPGHSLLGAMSGDPDPGAVASS